ncbi:hypothetical protein Tco_1431187 [Tanacetum coccineum]
MASMNTRLNIEKLDGNIVQRHGGSKQVGFNQLGPGIEIGVHGVSNDDTIVAQRRLEDKQPEETTNTECLEKEQKKEYQTGWKIKTGNVLDSCNQSLVRPREDSNEAAFAVGAVEKIYAHESLNFNDTVACEVISKWKARLKDDMDARSDVYVLSNGCKKCSDDSDGYYWESTQGIRVEHSILSLEDSLSGDCDVEKNGKWSCIYAVGSQEYQMVCTRLDIASADVGMLDKFDHGLQTYRFFVDFEYAMGRSITSGVYDTYGGYKGGYLAKETRNRVRIRAKDSSGYCYMCLVKGCP